MVGDFGDRAAEPVDRGDNHGVAGTGIVQQPPNRPGGVSISGNRAAVEWLRYGGSSPSASVVRLPDASRCVAAGE